MGLLKERLYTFSRVSTSYDKDRQWKIAKGTPVYKVGMYLKDRYVVLPRTDTNMEWYMREEMIHVLDESVRNELIGEMKDSNISNKQLIFVELPEVVIRDGIPIYGFVTKVDYLICINLDYKHG